MNRLLIQIFAMITSAFVLVVVTSDVSLSRGAVAARAPAQPTNTGPKGPGGVTPPKSNPTTATKPKGPDNVTAPRSPTPAGPVVRDHRGEPKRGVAPKIAPRKRFSDTESGVTVRDHRKCRHPRSCR